MKHFLFIMSFLFVLPVFAQEALQSTPESPVSAKRLELAEKMHEVWPIRLRIEAAIDAVAENAPADKQAEVKATMRKNIQYDAVEEESIKAMADNFTEEELQAMIDFYGSETGRSISAKTSDYELALRPVLGKMLDKAMLDLKTGAASKP